MITTDRARAPERVSVKVNGRIFERWTACEISRSRTALAASFSLAVPWWMPAPGEALLARPGDACEVEIGGEPVIAGYIDKVAPGADPDRIQVRISGRSRAGDLVDCSAIVPGGQLRGLSLPAAVRRLCEPFGIQVRVADGVDLPSTIELIEVEQSETVAAVIQRLCRDAQVLCWSDANGDLVLGRGARGRADSAIVHRFGPNGEPRAGNTVESLSGSFDASARFSDVFVRGQARSVIGKGALEAASPEGQARDEAVTRWRPRVVSAENNGDRAHMKARAEWEVARRVAEGTKIEVTVSSWRQSPGGALWDIGLMVPVVADLLNIDDDLMVTGVRFRQDANAARTELTLEPPQAQEPVAKQKKSAGSGQWESVRKQTHS